VGGVLTGFKRVSHKKKKRKTIKNKVSIDIVPKKDGKRLGGGVVGHESDIYKKNGKSWCGAWEKG